MPVGHYHPTPLGTIYRKGCELICHLGLEFPLLGVLYQVPIETSAPYPLHKCSSVSLVELVAGCDAHLERLNQMTLYMKMIMTTPVRPPVVFKAEDDNV